MAGSFRDAFYTKMPDAVDNIDRAYANLAASQAAAAAKEEAEIQAWAKERRIREQAQLVELSEELDGILASAWYTSFLRHVLSSNPRFDFDKFQEVFSLDPYDGLPEDLDEWNKSQLLRFLIRHSPDPTDGYNFIRHFLHAFFEGYFADLPNRYYFDGPEVAYLFETSKYLYKLDVWGMEGLIFGRSQTYHVDGYLTNLTVGSGEEEYDLDDDFSPVSVDGGQVEKVAITCLADLESFLADG
jgi:hypothetical protein